MWLEGHSVVQSVMSVHTKVRGQRSEVVNVSFSLSLCQHRLSISRSIPLPVMCGAMALSCTRYGAWDTSHLKDTPTPRLGGVSIVD